MLQMYLFIMLNENARMVFKAAEWRGVCVLNGEVFVCCMERCLCAEWRGVCVLNGEVFVC